MIRVVLLMLFAGCGGSSGPMKTIDPPVTSCTPIGVSAQDLWCVQHPIGANVFHYDGKSWTPIAVPPIAQGAQSEYSLGQLAVDAGAIWIADGQHSPAMIRIGLDGAYADFTDQLAAPGWTQLSLGSVHAGHGGVFVIMSGTPPMALSPPNYVAVLAGDHFVFDPPFAPGSGGFTALEPVGPDEAWAATNASLLLHRTQGGWTTMQVAGNPYVHPPASDGDLWIQVSNPTTTFQRWNGNSFDVERTGEENVVNLVEQEPIGGGRFLTLGRHSDSNHDLHVTYNYFDGLKMGMDQKLMYLASCPPADAMTNCTSLTGFYMPVRNILPDGSALVSKDMHLYLGRAWP